MKRKAVIHKPQASQVIMAVSALLWSLLFIFIMNHSSSRHIEHLSQKANFQARDFLGKDLKMSPKIKVFAFDDKTISYLNSAGMSYEEWVFFLRSIDRKKPKAIVIDQIFSIAAPGKPTARKARNVRRQLKNIKTPIFTGSFAYPVPVKGRPTFPLKSKRHTIYGLSGQKTGVGSVSANHGKYVYGADPGFRKLFNKVAHIHYNGNGKIFPLLHTEKGKFLNHISFSPFASKFKSDGERLFFGNERVPLNRNGELNINWLPKSTFYKSVLAGRSHLKDAFDYKANEAVNKGDIVVIIPFMFTGNTDFKETPYGMMPGGAHIVSMINSISQRAWIKTLNFDEILIVAMIVIGALAGGLLSPFLFASFSSFLIVAIVAAGLFLFSYVNISFGWMFAASAYIFSSITTFVFRARDAERQSLIVKSALDGAITTDKVDRISKKPQELNLEASERVVTVLFIDVVGFSLIAENQIPRHAFEELKKSLSSISHIINQNGGVVNKNLGDGLLCFFGYDLENDRVSPDHAEKAMIAAIRIQEYNLIQSLKSGATDGVVFPLRIGVHTTSVFMGDLGSGSRIDFTVIGNGVNFAKRLEGACQANSILISHTTRELVTNLMLDREFFSEKKIKIKHHTELITTFEYDPFHNQKELRNKAESAFRSCVNAARIEQRWVLGEPGLITLSSNCGIGELINFSKSGMSIKLKKSMAKGEQIVMVLKSKRGELEHSLASENLRQISCEVAWSYSEKDGHVHGVRFTGIALEKSDQLIKLLREHGSLKSGSIVGTGPISRIGEAV